MPITFPEYESFDGLGLANLIQRKVISPAEMLNAAIERLELWNPKLNAVIHKMYDSAQNGIKIGLSEGSFQGVPLLLKDILADYAGAPMCFGSRFAFNHHWTSRQDSEVVKRLKKAGFVIFGKTNLPEFGLSPTTEPELFGPTRNPWDLERTPGGSSGGAAAAVSARIVPIAHAGDGGGSIRMPAAFTGLFGFKPSRGRTPIGPINMQVWQGMVVEHALTRSVRDSAAMLDVLAGPEIGSPISLPKPEYSYLNQLKTAPRALRIALIEKPFFTAQVVPSYLEAQHRAAQLCQELGHRIEPEAFILNEDVPLALLIIMIAENTAALDALAKAIGRKPKSNELEKTTAMMCHAAREFNSEDYAWAQHTLDMVSLQLGTFFEKYDVILTPTVPFPAPKVGEYNLDHKEKLGIKLLSFLPYGRTLRQFLKQAAEKKFSFTAFTALFNICGNPAMSVPLYWDNNNLPIGIQFAAKVGDDLTLLQLAQQLEDAESWLDIRPKEHLPSAD
ncbi:MAG: amidase [Gammaproteobacteria bacterium]